MPAGGYQSIFRDGLFTEQVALVTGGGTGIGRCIAHEFAALGGTAVLLGRREAELAKTAAEITDAEGAADFEAADIRNDDAVQAAVTRIVARHGRIDALVNNAGGQFPSPAEALSPNGWRAVVDLNLTGTFLVARAVHAASMAAHGGAIVSIVAPVERGFPFFAHSGAARAGVINLTRTLAAEWAPHGVRVNAVAPGVIASGGLENYPQAQQRQLAQQARKAPVSRFGTESEVAAAVVFLLSRAAAFITGETLHVDGGVGLSPHPGGPADPSAALLPFDGFQFARTGPGSRAAEQ